MWAKIVPEFIKSRTASVKDFKMKSKKEKKAKKKKPIISSDDSDDEVFIKKNQ